MARFRMAVQDAAGNKTGLHRIGDKIFHGGDVVVSDEPLDRLFKNKFERIDYIIPPATQEDVDALKKELGLD
jgi:hypothetical protein